MPQRINSRNFHTFVWFFGFVIDYSLLYLFSPAALPEVLATHSGFFAGKAIGPGLLASYFTSDYCTMIVLPSIVKLMPLYCSIFKTADAFEFLEIRP